MTWTQPSRTFTAGQIAGVASGLQKMSDNLTAIGGAWTSYTPTITCGGTAITLGNGAIDAAYKVMGDKTVFFRVSFSVGSTTALGSGTVQVTLPTSARSTSTGHAVGAYVITGPTIQNGSWRNTSTTAIQFYAGGVVGSVGSMGLASGSVLLINGLYEGA